MVYEDLSSICLRDRPSSASLRLDYRLSDVGLGNTSRAMLRETHTDGWCCVRILGVTDKNYDTITRYTCVKGFSWGEGRLGITPAQASDLYGISAGCQWYPT